MQYEREKSRHGGTGANQHQQKAQSEPSAQVADKLATQHKVARETIKRDAQYARAVNAVDKAAGKGANV